MSSTPNPVPRHDPPNIPPSTLCTTHAYHSPTRLRRLYYDTDPNKTPYLYITNVPPTLITQSLEQDRFVQTKALITYDYPSRTLIMKGHPRRQELAKEIFNSEFLMFRYGMGRWALVPHGSATVADGDVVFLREPDPEKEKEKDWVWGVDEIKESMGLVWRYGED
ncbi:short chain dehydrogenase family protein [Aspergillus niger]|uniref:Short chain dehydrogenase family protein n=1 Tax=Aspergillus niger TaxID=5061 RepID=A0A505HZR2_ASPNG|nr:short chain dehydrogenase family protein [Aspergillus niger]